MGFGGYAFPPAKQGLGERWMMAGEEERNGNIPCDDGRIWRLVFGGRGQYRPDTHGVLSRHLYPSVYPVLSPPRGYHRSLSWLRELGWSVLCWLFSHGNNVLVFYLVSLPSSPPLQNGKGTPLWLPKAVKTLYRHFE